MVEHFKAVLTEEGEQALTDILKEERPPIGQTYSAAIHDDPISVSIEIPLPQGVRYLMVQAKHYRRLTFFEMSIRKHLERIVEARKCCEFLVECPGLANENLIDPLAILADEYAAKHLPHLSPEELQKAEEELVAEQARSILYQLSGKSK